MRDWTRETKSRGDIVGLVPTMGYLHEGHLSLVRASVRKTGRTVASIFVNPAQFAPHEDFADYPRDMERDLELLRAEEVDAVFTPTPDALYPGDYRTYVEVHDLQDRLCGKSRPIFFRGVCTIVLKLLHIIDPDVAFFGQKDAQQSVIIRRMVTDLDLKVRIEVCPIVRDTDGLALSSRNVFLSPEDRRDAAGLQRSLLEVQRAFEDGEPSTRALLRLLGEGLKRYPRLSLQYGEVVDPRTLDALEVARSGSVVAVAAHCGSTRLIDNHQLMG